MDGTGKSVSASSQNLACCIAENEEQKLKEVGGRTYTNEVECIILLLACVRLAILLCVASPDNDCVDKGTGMLHMWQ